MGFKYIVVSVEFGGIPREFPIIFPDALIHSQVFEALTVHSDAIPGKDPKVVAAGECQIDCTAVEGRSTTLKVVSRGVEDERLINAFPYCHGIG